jgi:signal transduction histidine kinase
LISNKTGRKLKVETNYIEDKCRLLADLDKIPQVVSNLLRNALQYTTLTFIKSLHSLYSLFKISDYIKPESKDLEK